MIDNEEKFRNLPVIRSKVADPMKTSREMEDIFDNLKKSPDNSQINQDIASLKISNRELSEVVSSSIINSQRDYNNISYNIENFTDTYEEIGWEIQDTMYDQLIELEKIRKQEDIKINLQKKRIEKMDKNSKHLESIEE